MELSEKIVINIPLDILWTEKEILDVKRERYLSRDEIRTLMQNGPVQFVIANPGDKLSWLSIADSYGVYKNNIRDHLIDPAGRIDLDSLKGHFGYLASLWTGTSDTPIILLEKIH